MEYEKLKLVINNENERSNENKEEELKKLLEEYSCKEAEGPKWCVWGKGLSGGHKIQCWIKPCTEDHLTAQQIKKLLNDLGGNVTIKSMEEYKLDEDNLNSDFVKNS